MINAGFACFGSPSELIEDIAKQTEEEVFTIIVRNVSENVVCAVRMGGMGVAIGSLIGEEAAGLCI